MKPYLLFLLVFSCPLFAHVEQSVISVMDNPYLPNTEQFTTNQWEEIHGAMEGDRIRVVTYNMLFNRYDFIRPEEYRWPARLPRIAEWIKRANPDVIASQELYQDQLDDLLALIGDRYAFYGVPSVNADGSESELNGIFYKKERLDRVFAESLFMSPTPDMPSSDPFGGMKRTLTGVHLKDRKTGKVFAIYNAHHSFGSADSREYSTRFTLNHLSSLMEAMPLIVTGDLNTFPTRIDVDLPFYDGHYLHRLFREYGFEEAYDRALLGHIGPLATFTNAPNDGTSVFAGTGTPGVFLDHLYVNRLALVLMHGVDPARVDGYFPSDHMPCIADLVL